MIIFKKLRWKNFLSTGNIFTEIELNKHNTTLIVGENGAGKSTILDALSYALFGKPFRKVNKPQLLNSITKKDMVVEIEFSINANNYKIIRGMKPNVFEVYMNGSMLNQSAEMKDYQEILEKQILKINHKSFCQIAVLGSATYQPFMQLPGGQRREIIEDLLDLQIFTTMNALLKEKVTDNKDALTDTVNNQKILKEKIKLIKSHMLEMQNNNDKLVEEKKERILEANEQIEQLAHQGKIIAHEVETLKEQTASHESLQKKVKKLQSLKVEIETNLKIVNKDIDFFQSHDNCPTCKQEIDGQFKCDTIDKKKAQADEIKDGLDALIKKYDELNKKVYEIVEIENEINTQQLELHRLKTKINSLIEYKDQLEDEIRSIKKNTKQNDDTKIQDLTDELLKLSDKLNDLSEEKDVLTAASVLLKDGGIKSKIIKQYVPVINKLIGKYLSAMDFFVQFELDEEFNETIKSRFRDEFSYASFSEGEKMRINLAILFTWRAVAKLRNSVNCNILIMDEVFDSSLDANGTEEFLKIINSLTTDTNTFIISHKGDQLYDKFTNIIKFEKHKNFSRIA
jgi:DNA repair exonuclease SbcCD ATPase subunit